MDPEISQAIGPNTEDLALREEIARLRASLTALLLQKDELVLIQCKRIESAYLRRFGALELRVYETWCACLRAKKKAKLVRASVNRREQADLNQIEESLDRDLERYRRELEERFNRVSGVNQGRQGPGLSAAGTKELKSLYRQAVKALHPDLHPRQDENRTQALDRAMRAYRSGDLETLRAVCETLEAPAEAEVDGLEALRAEAARLRRSVREIDRQLEAVKAQYPYNVRVYLEDPERGSAREAELRAQLRELQTRAASYEAAIAAMLSTEEEEP